MSTGKANPTQTGSEETEVTTGFIFQDWKIDGDHHFKIKKSESATWENDSDKPGQNIKGQRLHTDIKGTYFQGYAFSSYKIWSIRTAECI